jgi:hypothetical protein
VKRTPHEIATEKRRAEAARGVVRNNRPTKKRRSPATKVHS